GVIAALSVLLLFASVAAVFSLFQLSAAEQQRRFAEQQRRSAVSRELVLKAFLLRDSQPRMSLALSIEAFNIAPKMQEARDGLLSAQARYYGSTLLANKGAVHTVAYNHDGTLLATAQHDQAVCLWRMPDRQLKLCLGTADPTYGVAFSPDDRV